MSEDNSLQTSELKQRSAAISLSVAISALYIGIASGLLIFVLQKNPDLTVLNYELLSAIFCICSVIFHMFAGEFFMLSIWHQNKISRFAWYGSICYGIGQAFLFIGIAFVVRFLGHKILSISFLSLIVFFWCIYYWIRLKNIIESDYTSSRWIARGFIFLMYFLALILLIKW